MYKLNSSGPGPDYFKGEGVLIMNLIIYYFIRIIWYIYRIDVKK